MSLDFLILYEHVVREYESILLLSEELRRRGYSCEIRQLLDRKKLKYFTWKKPKVLVASNLYDNEGLNSHVYNNVGRLDKVVNLHWEQMLSDTQEAEPWFNFAGSAKKCVQTCWGEETRRRLIAHGVPERNAPVTGAVMMDFLRPEFAGYFDDKETLCKRHGLDPAKKLMLYISSFGYASMGEAEVKELSEMAGTDFSAFAAVNRSSMATTLEWFDRYLAAHPEVELVYRRHPSEWDSPALAAMAEKHQNFHVIFEDSVKQWITAADQNLIWMSSAIAEVYFARGCVSTSGGEADANPMRPEGPQGARGAEAASGRAAGRGCVVLRPEPIPHAFDPVIYRDCAAATTFEAFAAAADGPAGAPFPIEKDMIERYFSHTETPAYKRMANLLEDVYKNPPRDHPFDADFKPRFNWLKYFALIGVHVLFALRLKPPGFAGRIYGYVEKAHLPKKQRAAMRAKIQKYIR